MKLKIGFFIAVCFVFGIAKAQMYLDEENVSKQEVPLPNTVDFSNILNQKKSTRDEYENVKRQRDIRLSEKFAPKESAEKSIDPFQYKVGPGDIFSLNVWGALEMQIPLIVNPEGKLLVPSVGEIQVDGLSLTDVQKQVVEKSKPFYEKSTITITLEKMRTFRVHVVGEVIFPGTYVSQAVYRVSEMIYEAGGLTNWAWNREIELRHFNNQVDTVDLSLFEQEGKTENDLFVNGGDIIYVPPVSLKKSTVQVEGDSEIAGIYQICPQETLLEFLKRIRSLNKNTDFTKIKVNRQKTNKSNSQYFNPFFEKKDSSFMITNGDRIVLPSKYVYVRGSVQKPGAYPFALSLTAKDYAGMAGVVGNINGAKVYHSENRKTKKGPHVLVDPGDVVDVPETWSQKLKNYLGIASTITSLIIAAKAIGL